VPAFPEGTVIDNRFAVRGVLGTGGMGTVYLAQQRSMDREVALKVLRDELASDDHAVERFLREAQASSRLHNPHTVTVLDAGRTEDGLLYIAMERLNGRTLADLLEEHDGRLPPLRAIAIIEQVLDSLEEAHSVGILHRDVKPENIFLLDDIGARDFVKVLDFGIARIDELPPTQATVAHLVVGTPLYMSPEQMECGRQDARSDLYSLAFLFFQLLSGRTPYEGDNPLVITIKKVTERVPKVNEIAPDAAIPEGLQFLLERTLQPSKEKRPRDVAEFRELLFGATRALRDDSSLFALGDHAPTPHQTLAPPQIGAPPQPLRPGPAVPSPLPPQPNTPRPVPRPERPSAVGFDSLPPPPAPPVVNPETPPPIAPRPGGNLLRDRPGSLTPLAPASPSRDGLRTSQPERLPFAPRDRLTTGDSVRPEVTPVATENPFVSSRNRTMPGDRRAAQRLPCLVSLHYSHEGAEQTGTMTDVNEAGAFVAARLLPALGTTIDVRLPGRAKGRIIVFSALVMRVVETPNVPGAVRGYAVRWRSVKQSPVHMTILQALAEVSAGSKKPFLRRTQY